MYCQPADDAADSRAILQCVRYLALADADMGEGAHEGVRDVAEHAYERHLVSRAGNSLKKSCEGRQDLLGGLGPDERPGVMVPRGHPGADVLLERLD